jgi:hypothetical protein
MTGKNIEIKLSVRYAIKKGMSKGEFCPMLSFAQRSLKGRINGSETAVQKI